MITSPYKLFIHNLKPNRKGWGCTTKAEGHFIIAKLLNRLRCDSSSEILSPKSSCLASKLRCEVAGCDRSPLYSLHSQTHSRPLTGQISRLSLSLRAVVLIWPRWECGCVNREQRVFPPDCDSLLLWLTRILTKTLRRHGDAHCRPLGSSAEAALRFHRRQLPFTDKR